MFSFSFYRVYINMLVTLASAPGFGLYKYVPGLVTCGLDLGAYGRDLGVGTCDLVLP